MPKLFFVYAAVGTMLLPVFACTMIGFEWGRRKLAYPGAFVSTLVTSVAVPALIFSTLATTPLETTTLFKVAFAAVSGIVVMAGLSAMLLKLRGLPVRQLLPTSTFPNAGNLGLPLSQLAFGEAGLSVAVTFFAVASFLQHTAGVYTISASEGGKSALRSPVMFAVFLAVGMRSIGLTTPPWILETSRLLGALTVPLMLISLGYTLITISHGKMADGLYVGMVRLTVGIIGGTAVVKLLELPPAIAGVTLFQMMMPVAVVSYMYAERFTDHGETAAGAVLGSTVAFLLLTPLALWYVGAPIANN
jgi:predicted permease